MMRERLVSLCMVVMMALALGMLLLFGCGPVIGGEGGSLFELRVRVRDAGDFVVEGERRRLDVGQQVITIRGRNADPGRGDHGFELYVMRLDGEDAVGVLSYGGVPTPACSCPSHEGVLGVAFVLHRRTEHLYPGLEAISWFCWSVQGISTRSRAPRKQDGH